ncbi:MAG TPA: polyphosphate kinase 2 family protein [Candidatus Limnocylindrales bacterium]|jgi:polyphosphate:nucleotide phosphotransferase, PPK2 family|nr:polyphosphate kinase 2 family protein [Candidatus Limnocylindrales bacterium]
MGTKGKRGAFRELLGVKPGEKVNLARFDCGATFGRQKDEAEATLAANLARLTALQERIYAEAKHAVLIVLQGIDAAGKDGTISVIAGAFNPQGTPVTSFKVPTPEELAHDFLWRVHAAVPGKGEIGIFNRSHYEQVLIVRVHNLEPEARWRNHYREIRDWERMLTDEGTTILKFFLAIDKDEQRTRFQERIDDPTKRWKFKTADIAERKLWDDYTAAFEEMLSETSTDYAPWHLVPSNRNWLRNVAVSEIVADALDELNPQYPEAEAGVEGLKIV